MNVLNIHKDFPELFATIDWGFATADFALVSSAPAAKPVGNVTCVPFVGDEAVIIRVRGGLPDVPGGTLEPGEDYLAAIRRELREEAGALLHRFTVFGLWWCHSRATTPYRSHLPHPDFARIVGYADVEIVSTPLNPPGGEQVSDVEVLPVTKIVEEFRGWNRRELAALYQLASILRRDSNAH